LLPEQGQSFLAMPGNKTSIGVLENCPRSRCQRGSIGIKTEDYDVFLFCF